MTTDITELAQDWKAAAHKAKQANDLYLEGKITLSECVVETKDYLDYSDNPNNFLALVEALEKAQETIAFQQGEIKALLSSLESRTVKLPKRKMLEDYLAEVAIEERKQILVGVKLEFHRACVAAGIKVEAE